MNIEKHVPDAMLQFPQKNAPAICRFFEFNVALKTLDGCREQVGIVLKEGNVVLVEIARLPRVHFENAPGSSLPLDNYVHHTSDLVLDQEFRDFEAIFCFCVR